jgi:hypothetical protein
MVSANIMISSNEQTTRGVPSALGLGVGLTTFTTNNKPVTKYKHEPQTWTDSFDKRPKRRNKDVRLGTWNVRSLYRAGSLVSVSKELPKYRLDLAVVREVRSYGGGPRACGRIPIFLWKRE